MLSHVFCLQIFELTPTSNLHAAETSQLSALFSSLWVLAVFSAEVWTLIIKLCLLNHLSETFAKHTLGS